MKIFLYLCLILGISFSNVQAQSLTIISPAITNGTQTSPIITTPTINNPVITGGSLVNLANVSSNPNPTSVATVYTSGNTTINLFNDSQDTLAQAWSDLFNAPGGQTHDTASFMATSSASNALLQTDALSAFCRNKNGTSFSSARNACVAGQLNVFNDVPGTASWSISQIFNENQDSSDTTTQSGYYNESDFKVKRPTTLVTAWQFILDGYIPTSGPGAGVPVQSESATGPDCLTTDSRSKWSSCFATGDGAATYFALVGMVNPGGTVTDGSQPIGFKTATVDGTTHVNTLYAQDQYTILSRSDSGSNSLSLMNGDVDVQTGHNFNVNGIPTPKTDSADHIVFFGATPPAPTACGTGASFASGATDNAGTIIVGTGSVSSCTLTFVNSFATSARPVPSCTAILFGSGQAVWLTARSSTAVTFSVATPMSAGVEINYHCL